MNEASRETAPPIDCAANAVHLLWTGGWDSTYRLFDALLSKGKTVQPHYLRDTGRRSAEMELTTMRDLARRFAERFPHLQGRLLPPIVSERTDFTPRPELRAWYHALRKRGYLGSQYVWLAEYALDYGVDLELAIHRDDRANEYIKDDVIEREVGHDEIFVLAAELSDPNLELFRPFHFPILALSKLDMAVKAEHLGVADLMAATWFCHHPRRGQPCGVCPPCQYTIEEGLGYRIPLSGRLLYRVAKPYFVLRRRLSKLSFRMGLRQ